MKLDPIKAEHVLAAANFLDAFAVPENRMWSQYFVVVSDIEYPFKSITERAFWFAMHTRAELAFESKQNARDYIEAMGFEIRYYPEGKRNEALGMEARNAGLSQGERQRGVRRAPPFFTREELELYHRIANKKYDKDDDEHQEYAAVLKGLAQKLHYWAEQCCYKEFRVVRDNRWQGKSQGRFSHYLWPRMVKGEDKAVFFNVEINAKERWIGYKLDGYYRTKKALPLEYQHALDGYKEEIRQRDGEQWIKIPYTQVETYDWDHLIRDTKTYMIRYEADHDRLKERFSRELKLARITWNTNGWQHPSGRVGKSKDKESHEYKHGFGHEEWLLDGGTIIEGYKYGFLEPIHKFPNKYIGQVFARLSLYTRDADAGQYYWVGTLHDVEVIHREEAGRIARIYQERGWYQSMKADLEALHLKGDDLDAWIQNGVASLFNVRFQAAQLATLPHELVPVGRPEDIGSDRYILLNEPEGVAQRYEEKAKTGFDFENSGSTSGSDLRKSKRRSKGGTREVKHLHNAIQEGLLAHLQEAFGTENVKAECTAYGAARIDLVRKRADGKFVFYEIKTFNSPYQSIRAALGQLMEYCFCPDVVEAEELVIVSHVPPDAPLRNYMRHLQKQVRFQLSYVFFDLDQGRIAASL